MPFLNLLKQLITINSYTKNKVGVDAVGELLGSWLKALGLSETIYKREFIGNHRLYKSSSQQNSKHLLLLGHLDTVFPAGTFEGFREDKEWVYGPGTCDMKGGLIVAYEALNNLYKNNVQIINIDFLLVSDEESGSDDSKYLSSELAKEYDYCLVFEAAGINMEVVIGRKGVGTFNIDIQGLAKHAGNHYADGINANLEASYKLQKLIALTDLALNTTVNVGKIQGGIGANTISPQASLLFELRYDKEEEKKRVLSAVDEIVKTSYVKGTTSVLSGGIQRGVMQTSDAILAFVREIEKISHTKIPTEKRGGVSDANILSAAGVITLDGFGPYGDGDHTEDERALKSSFDSRIVLTTGILKHFIENKGM